MNKNMMNKIIMHLKNESELKNLFYLFLFSILSGSLFKFKRDFSQIAWVLASVLIVQVFLYFYLKENRFEKMLKMLTLSCYIAFGILLYFKNWNLYFHAASVLLTLLVYAWVKTASLKTTYNPLNLGIVLGICLFAPATFHLNISSFIFQTTPLVLVLLAGCIITSLRNKWIPILGYVTSLIVFALIDFLFFYGSLNYWIAPAFGFFGLVFIFLILPDHRIDFSSKISVYIYGLAVGVLAIVLKKHEFFYFEYLSMFIVSTLVNIYKVFCGSFNSRGPIVSRV